MLKGIMAFLVLFTVSLSADTFPVETELDIPYSIHCGVIFNGKWVISAHGSNLVNFTKSLLEQEVMSDILYHTSEIMSVSPSGPFWNDLYGDSVYVKYNNIKYLLAQNTVLYAKTIEGITCGYFIVEEKGNFGFMPVYGDDQYSIYKKEGPNNGEKVYLYVGKHRTDFCFKYYSGYQMIDLSGKTLRIIGD